MALIVFAITKMLMYGNKEENRRESNLRVVCRRERKKRKGEWR